MDFLNAWRGRRILVTGGTGFIGQHVIAQGLTAGVEVHSLTTHAVSNAPQQHCVDLADAAQVAAVVNAIKPEGVIHLAARGVAYGANELSALLQTNVVGLSNLLGAVASLDVKPTVVIAGSGFEYQPQERPLTEHDPVAPFSPYGVSKVCAALCASLYAGQMPITLLRLFSVYGPGEKEPRLLPYLIACARRREPVELTGCEQVRDYTHVTDAAQSFWRALAQPPRTQALRVLNVGTGIPVTLKQFVVYIADALQSQELLPELIFGAKPYRPGEPMTYLADVTRLRQELGWTPGIEIADGIRRSVTEML